MYVYKCYYNKMYVYDGYSAHCTPLLPWVLHKQRLTACAVAILSFSVKLFAPSGDGDGEGLISYFRESPNSLPGQ